MGDWSGSFAGSIANCRLTFLFDIVLLLLLLCLLGRGHGNIVKDGDDGIVDTNTFAVSGGGGSCRCCETTTPLFPARLDE